MKNVKNIMKVQQLENLNQFLMENDKMAIFQSYDSIIAVYDKENDVLTLGIDWDYSKTTTKHLYIFMNNLFDYNNASQYKELPSDLNWTTKKKQVIEKWIANNKIVFDGGLR